MSAPTMKGELMFPSLYLAAADLKGHDTTLTIARIEKADLQTTAGRESKWVVSFSDALKKLVLNKTNARAIAELHGPKAEAWIGKRIAVYPTTCSAFGKISECVRIRERVPGGRAADESPPPPKDSPE